MIFKVGFPNALQVTAGYFVIKKGLSPQTWHSSKKCEVKRGRIIFVPLGLNKRMVIVSMLEINRLKYGQLKSKICLYE